MNYLLTFILLLSFNSFASENAYKEFGEKKAIVNVVDDLMFNLLANEKTKKFFEFVDQEHVKKMLVDQFCEQLGGPCEYNGLSMKKSHEDQEISRDHFYALVEQLQKAMDKNNISQSAQTKLLSKLAVMHKDVVTK
jgi:hemoglobin